MSDWVVIFAAGDTFAAASRTEARNVAASCGEDGEVVQIKPPGSKPQRYRIEGGTLRPVKPGDGYA